MIAARYVLIADRIAPIGRDAGMGLVNYAGSNVSRGVLTCDPIDRYSESAVERLLDAKLSAGANCMRSENVFARNVSARGEARLFYGLTGGKI